MLFAAAVIPDSRYVKAIKIRQDFPNDWPSLGTVRYSIHSGEMKSNMLKTRLIHALVYDQ